MLKTQCAALTLTSAHANTAFVGALAEVGRFARFFKTAQALEARQAAGTMTTVAMPMQQSYIALTPGSLKAMIELFVRVLEIDRLLHGKVAPGFVSTGAAFQPKQFIGVSIENILYEGYLLLNQYKRDHIRDYMAKVPDIVKRLVREMGRQYGEGSERSPRFILDTYTKFREQAQLICSDPTLWAYYRKHSCFTELKAKMLSLPTLDSSQFSLQSDCRITLAQHYDVVPWLGNLICSEAATDLLTEDFPRVQKTLLMAHRALTILQNALQEDTSDTAEHFKVKLTQWLDQIAQGLHHYSKNISGLFKVNKNMNKLEITWMQMIFYRQNAKPGTDSTFSGPQLAHLLVGLFDFFSMLLDRNPDLTASDYASNYIITVKWRLTELFDEVLPVADRDFVQRAADQTALIIQTAPEKEFPEHIRILHQQVNDKLLGLPKAGGLETELNRRNVLLEVHCILALMGAGNREETQKHLEQTQQTLDKIDRALSTDVFPFQDEFETLLYNLIAKMAVQKFSFDVKFYGTKPLLTVIDDLDRRVQTLSTPDQYKKMRGHFQALKAQAQTTGVPEVATLMCLMPYFECMTFYDYVGMAFVLKVKIYDEPGTPELYSDSASDDDNPKAEVRPA